MEFPNPDLIKNPMVDLRYEIEIHTRPADVFPWLKQVGYHRGGWYIDTWWDEDLSIGDIVPDSPPGSAYYEVVGLEENRLLLLYATTHFNYVAPQFVYKTRFAPNGAFCWAFILDPIDNNKTRLTSWWRSEGYPKFGFYLIKPFFTIIDGAHQRAILQGLKKRVERAQK